MMRLFTDWIPENFRSPGFTLPERSDQQHVVYGWGKGEKAWGRASARAYNFVLYRWQNNRLKNRCPNQSYQTLVILWRQQRSVEKGVLNVHDRKCWAKCGWWIQGRAMRIKLHQGAWCSHFGTCQACIHFMTKTWMVENLMKNKTNMKMSHGVECYHFICSRAYSRVLSL